MSVMVEFVGAPDLKLTTEQLVQVDACFGKSFAKSSADCKSCTAPVIVGGKLALCNELCQSVQSGAVGLSTTVELTSRQVGARLEAGRDPFSIWREMLGTADPVAYGAMIRTKLYTRLSVLAESIEVPPLPTTAELLERLDGS